MGWGEDRKPLSSASFGPENVLAIIMELFPEWELFLTSRQILRQHCQQHSSVTSTTSIPLLLEEQ